MVDTRTVTLPAIWADDAITEIPTPPIANTTYRNTDLGSTELLQGWPYQKIVDSADFNQTLWLISNLVKSCEQYGIMPWCASTTYKQNGICLASNGIFYWAKKDNTGVNPVTDSGMTNWGVFLDPGDNFVTETVLMSQINLCEKLANKTQTLSSSSTSTQYPSAKAVYDNINNLQTSLQSAISAIQANYVTTNTDQTIKGTKVFNGASPIKLGKAGSTYTEVQFTSDGSAMLGGLRNIREGNSDNMQMYVASKDGSSILGSIQLNRDDNNGILATAPHPAASTNYNNPAIMTAGRAADPTQNFNLLHRSGNESITGVKTVENNNPKFGFKNTLADISNKPSANTHCKLFFVDKNGLFTGEIRNEFSTTGYLETALYTNSKISGTLKTSYIKVVVNENGEVYATCPTPPRADDNSTKISNTQWVNSRITSIMGTVYPVGSLYFGTQSTCPLAAIINGSMWEKVGSSLITSVNTSVPVKGNGKSMGWTNGGANFGCSQGDNGYGWVFPSLTSEAYGKNIGVVQAGNTGTRPSGGKLMGLTSDANNSGIVGTVTRTSLTVNIFKRTA